MFQNLQGHFIKIRLDIVFKHLLFLNFLNNMYPDMVTKKKLDQLNKILDPLNFV